MPNNPEQRARAVPGPGEFQAFLDRVFPEGGSGAGLAYTSYDMEEAFTGGYAAGRAAAVADAGPSPAAGAPPGVT